jgi:hypothetical protein
LLRLARKLTPRWPKYPDNHLGLPSAGSGVKRHE